jgi:hypothetical protein
MDKRLNIYKYCPPSYVSDKAGAMIAGDYQCYGAPKGFSIIDAKLYPRYMNSSGQGQLKEDTVTIESL